MGHNLLKLLIETLLIGTLVNSESLTFLGGKERRESMAVYSKWNAKQKATLNFQFKTAKKDGLLFYIHGDSKESHLRLTLEDGRLVFVVKHSELESIGEEFGTELHDLNWHNVTVIRNHRATLLDLDGTQRVMTILHWKKVLDLTSDLYVGNAVDESGNDIGKVSEQGFVGCIKDLKYGEGYKELTTPSLKFRGSNILNGCANYCKKIGSHKCRSGKCVNHFINYTCDCFGTGYEGTNCQTESPTISLQSRMDFMSKKVSSMRTLRSNKIFARFKTVKRNGILLTLGKANDYLTLEIYEARVRVETNVGGGKVVIQSDRPLNDGQWHDVKVIKNGADFTLVVDHRKKSRFEETKSSPYWHLDSYCRGSDIAYFGGHFNPITVVGSKSKQGFVGCLQQFYFNKVNIIKDTVRALEILKKWKGSQTSNTEIDGEVVTGCSVRPRPITEVITPPKTKSSEVITKRKQTESTKTDGNSKNTFLEPSGIQQTPKSGKRGNKKLEKSSVAWITAGLVIGALVIILVMAFLIHRFRKKYRGTFMAPRDENGTPYYSSVQATYHMQNGIGKRQGRGNATDV